MCGYSCRYKDQFGFTLPNRPIIVDDIRIRALAKSAMSIDRKIDRRPESKPLQETKVNCSGEYTAWDVMHGFL